MFISKQILAAVQFFSSGIIQDNLPKNDLEV